MQNKESNILADRFENFGAPASSEVWTGIEASLDQDKRRRGIIFWLISAAALIAFSALAYNFMSGSEFDSTQEKLEAGNQKLEDKNQKNDKSSNGEETASSTSEKEMDELNTESDTRSVNSGQHSTKDRAATTHGEIKSPKTTYITTSPEPEPKGHLSTVDLEISAIPEDDISDDITLLPYRSTSLLESEVLGMEPDVLSHFELVYIPRWEIAVRGYGFINSSISKSKVSSQGQFWTGPGSNTAPENKTFSHQRYAELEGIVMYRLFHRFKLGGGISASMGHDTEQWDDNITFSKRTTFGIPIYTEYQIYGPKRLSISGQFGILNEYSYIRSDVGIPSEPPNFNSDPGAGISAIENYTFESPYEFTGHGYAFGLYGGIEASYHLGTKMRITGSIGYRNYMVEKYSNSYLYTKNPGYLTGSIGLRWSLF